VPSGGSLTRKIEKVPSLSPGRGNLANKQAKLLTVYLIFQFVLISGLPASKVVTIYTTTRAIKACVYESFANYQTCCNG